VTTTTTTTTFARFECARGQTRVRAHGGVGIAWREDETRT
jgi:hypothetical protein